MFYNYLEPFNIISGIFGLRKPSLSSNGKITNSSVVHKIWSLVITSGVVASYYFTECKLRLNLKENLLQISILNDLVTNVIILVLHTINGEDVTKNLYRCIIGILTGLGLDDRRVKILVLKIFLWFSFLSGTFFATIVLEIIYDSPPYVLILRIPMFLTIFHLIFHLYLLVAILKILNYKLYTDTLMNNIPALSNTKITKINILKYFLNPDINFIEKLHQNQYINVDLKQLCKMYDQMATCHELLIKLHGLQIFFVVWLTFSNAVVGVTSITCNQAKVPWLACIKTVLPYFWCYIGAYVGDQLRQQVDSTEMILIKHLIDFRCDQTRKITVETFRHLVGANRLQFTACSLFDMSYSMILGMAMNVITYSIILIQLFLSD